MYDINLRNVKRKRFFAIFFIFGIVFLAVPLFLLIAPFIERSKLRASTLSLPIKETNQKGKLVKCIPYYLEDSCMAINNVPIKIPVIDYILPDGRNVILHVD